MRMHSGICKNEHGAFFIVLEIVFQCTFCLLDSSGLECVFVPLWPSCLTLRRNDRERGQATKHSDRERGNAVTVKEAKQQQNTMTVKEAKQPNTMTVKEAKQPNTVIVKEKN